MVPSGSQMLAKRPATPPPHVVLNCTSLWGRIVFGELIITESTIYKKMAQLLSESEIKERLNQLSDWTLEGKTIKQTFRLKDFVEAIDFVNRLVEPAESAAHHPDIEISYNRVSVSLTTHDAGGLTEADFKLAQVISQI